MPATLEPSTPEATDALLAVLSDALMALAAEGRSDHANRLAGRAYSALRQGQPARAQRINVLMHRLARIPDTSHTRHDQGADHVDH